MGMASRPRGTGMAIELATRPADPRTGLGRNAIAGDSEPPGPGIGPRRARAGIGRSTRYHRAAGTAHAAPTDARQEAFVTIYVTHWSMTSDLTAESAYRLADKWAKSWRLSWLPERLLTREQALAGMDLAEI